MKSSTGLKVQPIEPYTCTCLCGSLVLLAHGPEQFRVLFGNVSISTGDLSLSVAEEDRRAVLSSLCTQTLRGSSCWQRAQQKRTM